MRLDKFLAQSTNSKRKDIRIHIKDGQVKVNDRIVTEPAIDINEFSDSIEYNGDIIKYKDKVYYMFHKPMGCISAKRDNVHKTVFDYFEDVDMDGVSHIGRLDKDTEGLLLFTNDGEFNNELMNPKKHMTKKYFFIALGSLSEEDKKLLREGISIGEDEEITKSAEIEVIKEGTYDELKDELNLEKYHFVNSNFYEQKVTAGNLIITEGRKHQVKRMIKAVGCYVIYLKRISIGNLQLDQTLEKGKYRSLTLDEINMLRCKANV